MGGILHGTGTASTFTVDREAGTSFAGGAAQRTIACAPCTIRITLTAADVRVAQDGVVFALQPGAYEIREFTGTFAYTTRAPRDFAVTLDGSGLVRAL